MVEHLSNLSELGLNVWSDDCIETGLDVLAEITQALESCDGAILLVSKDFLNSSFVRSVEIPALLEARHERGAFILPVIAQSCIWKRISWLGKMLAHDGGKVVGAMRKPLRDVSWTKLTLDVGERLQLFDPPNPPAGGDLRGTIELTLEGDFDLPEVELERLILDVLQKAADPSAEIVRRKPGSLKLYVELPVSAMAHLREQIESGLLVSAGFRLTGENIEVEVPLLRGEYVLLDETLAKFFDRPVKAINQARARNEDRFDASYAFQLSEEEWADLKSQFVTAKPGRGGRRTPPWVYTEKGAAMLATQLRTPRAVEASKLIVETFVEARRAAPTVPPANNDGIGEPDRMTDAKEAFKDRLRSFDRARNQRT